MSLETGKQRVVWLKRQILLKTRLIKYGVVGCVGIVVNLGTLSFLFAVSPGRGWTQSALANVASTAGNFVLHNLWTFSDRQHQGSRLVRGFLFFASMSAVGICITTAAYASFARIAAQLMPANSHSNRLGILLACQFVAILFGASLSYALNSRLTWPATRDTAQSDPAQFQEACK